jgi:hypothetical protein
MSSGSITISSSCIIGSGAFSSSSGAFSSWLILTGDAEGVG